ncbi:MAG: TIGR01777 family protein [Bacteroidetes bacterium]|nr:MAG: TIGR01777 family protein [Bacteroidota bacterium]
MKKIILMGGSGYVGLVLAKYFIEKNYEVIIVARHQPKNMPSQVKFMNWDGENLGEWAKSFENAEVIINLAGKSVNCRYNEKNKAQIFSSRLKSTAVIGKAIQNCENPPKNWFNSSTGTIYRHAEDYHQDENKGEKGKGFSVEVATQWEKIFNEAITPHTRKIALRMSIVFGKSGGAFPYYARLAKYGLGGKMGKGTQRISWVHDYDLCRCIDFLIENKHLEGAINIATPDAVTNEDFMKKLRKHYKVFFGLLSTTLMLRFGTYLLGSETELILKSRWVYPQRLLEAGFNFEYDTVDKALKFL